MRALFLVLALGALLTACAGAYPPSSAGAYYNPDDPGPPPPSLWPALGLGPDPTMAPNDPLACGTPPVPSCLENAR